MSQRESALDQALRLQSEAVREARQAAANDQRMQNGQDPQHCGVDAKLNSNGDYDCTGRCGVSGIA